jgi:hypothetical protein
MSTPAAELTWQQKRDAVKKVHPADAFLARIKNAELYMVQLKSCPLLGPGLSGWAGSEPLAWTSAYERLFPTPPESPTERVDPERHANLEWGDRCPAAPDHGPHECAGSNVVCRPKLPAPPERP